MKVLNKISAKNKVSDWLSCVNDIIDALKLAVAPTKYNSEGLPEDGEDGLLSREDKKKIDDLPITYMPIRGELPTDATWTTAKEIDSDDAFYLTIESENVQTYNVGKSVKIDVTSGRTTECSTKHISFFPPKTGSYNVTIDFEGNTTEYSISYKKEFPLVLRFTFVGGTVFFEELLK